MFVYRSRHASYTTHTRISGTVLKASSLSNEQSTELGCNSATTCPESLNLQPSRPPSSAEMAELLLDPNIRLWVVLPIVFITFFVGIIRHYVSLLLTSQKKVTLQQVSDG